MTPIPLAVPLRKEGTGTLARMTLSPSLRKPPASFGLRDWTPASEPIVRWLFSILEKALQGQIPLTFRCVTLSNLLEGFEKMQIIALFIHSYK